MTMGSEGTEGASDLSVCVSKSGVGEKTNCGSNNFDYQSFKDDFGHGNRTKVAEIAASDYAPLRARLGMGCAPAIQCKKIRHESNHQGSFTRGRSRLSF